MAGFATKKLGWFRTPSAYQSMTAWREKRAQMREKFEAQQTEISNKLLSVGDAQNQGMAEIFAQIALKRVTEEGKAKIAKNEEMAKYDTEVDTGKADINDSIFSDSTSATLDGGTKIDLGNDTLTLSDGTVLDIKTGAKKIKIDVTA